MSVTFIDNSDEVLSAFEEAVNRGLKRCGEKAVGYAFDLCIASTGNLRDSIESKVDESEPAAYVGTNVEYGPYVEFGTGSKAAGGGGRPGWWVYVPGSSGGKSGTGKVYTKQEAVAIMMSLRKKGVDAHITNGQEPKPFIKPAVDNHKQTYKNIIKDELENG